MSNLAAKLGICLEMLHHGHKPVPPWLIYKGSSKNKIVSTHKPTYMCIRTESLRPFLVDRRPLTPGLPQEETLGLCGCTGWTPCSRHFSQPPCIHSAPLRAVGAQGWRGVSSSSRCASCGRAEALHSQGNRSPLASSRLSGISE